MDHTYTSHQHCRVIGSNGSLSGSTHGVRDRLNGWEPAADPKTYAELCSGAHHPRPGGSGAGLPGQLIRTTFHYFPPQLSRLPRITQAGRCLATYSKTRPVPLFRSLTKLAHECHETTRVMVFTQLSSLGERFLPQHGNSHST